MTSASIAHVSINLDSRVRSHHGEDADRDGAPHQSSVLELTSKRSGWGWGWGVGLGAELALAEMVPKVDGNRITDTWEFHPAGHLRVPQSSEGAAPVAAVARRKLHEIKRDPRGSELFPPVCNQRWERASVLHSFIIVGFSLIPHHSSVPHFGKRCNDTIPNVTAVPHQYRCWRWFWCRSRFRSAASCIGQSVSRPFKPFFWGGTW